jgi:photosystem II stability/assembly factor-like uncharacterized protein
LESGIYCCDGKPGNTGVVFAFAVDPARPTSLYAGTSAPITNQQPLDASGVFRSSDGGVTWIRSVEGLPDPQIPDILSLIVGGETPGTVFAGTGTGVFKSRNQGVSWSQSGLAGSEVNVLRFDPQDSAALLAGLENGGVYRSEDAGRTWLPSSAGLTGAPVWDLLFSPANPGELYAATDGDGVFVSRDAGRSWRTFNEGFDSLRLTKLAFDSSDSYLFAGSIGRGVWIREILTDRFPPERTRSRPPVRIVPPHTPS